jgi:hypothetical protein
VPNWRCTRRSGGGWKGWPLRFKTPERRRTIWT